MVGAFSLMPTPRPGQQASQSDVVQAVQGVPETADQSGVVHHGLMVRAVAFAAHGGGVRLHAAGAVAAGVFLQHALSTVQGGESARLVQRYGGDGGGGHAAAPFTAAGGRRFARLRIPAAAFSAATDSHGRAFLSAPAKSSGLPAACRTDTASAYSRGGASSAVHRRTAYGAR